MGLVKQDTIKQFVYPSAQAMLDSLAVWHREYNFIRKHRKLGRLTLWQAVCDWYQRQPDIFSGRLPNCSGGVHNLMKLDS
jgi:hypothetical protein